MQEKVKKLREKLGADGEFASDERLAMFLAIVQGETMEALAMAKGYVKTMKELKKDEV